MIESYLKHSDILKVEPSLDDYLRSDEIDLSDIINEAKSEMIDDIIDRGQQPRRLCKRLSLQTPVTKTSVFTGKVSAEDYAGRRRLVIDVTAISGDAEFTLQGTDDESTYEDIVSIPVSGEGQFTTKFDKTYKKYRLKLTSVTSITYSAYLIETNYETAHRYKVLSMAFNKLRYRISDDNFNAKYREYEEIYQKKLDTMRFFYDRDDSGTITEDEGYTSVNVRFSRG